MFKSDVDRAGFVQRLGLLIESKGLTHRAAAQALGVAESQMARYFVGQIPEPGKLLRIARWGGATMEWLLTGQDDDNGRMAKVPSAQVTSGEAPHLAIDVKDLSMLTNTGVSFRKAFRNIARRHLEGHIRTLAREPTDEENVRTTVDTLLSISEMTPRGQLLRVPSWTTRQREELRKQVFDQLLKATTTRTTQHQWSQVVKDLVTRLIK